MITYDFIYDRGAITLLKPQLMSQTPCLDNFVTTLCVSLLFIFNFSQDDQREKVTHARAIPVRDFRRQAGAQARKRERERERSTN